MFNIIHVTESKNKQLSLEKSDIWVIIPGYNEEKYIARVLKKTLEITRNIVVVDDGSQDQTATIAQKIVPHVLQHQVNMGKGAAMKTGTEYAFQKLNAEAVIFMDADDQHNPLELLEFIKQLKKGHSVIFGIRKFSEKDMPFHRFLGNKIASALVSLLFHNYIPDIPSGFKAFTKDSYRKIRWKSQGYEVEMEIAVNVAKARLPYTTVEIETIYHDFDKGMNILDGLAVLFNLLKWRIGI